MNKGLNCDIGQLFTRNYRKIKTGFTFAFSYLNLQATLLVTYKTLNKLSFPGIILLRII